MSISSPALDPEAQTASTNTGSCLEGSIECAKCHVLLGLQVRPRFVHESSNVLCTMRPAACIPLDLLPSMLAAQCGECSSVMVLKNVQVGGHNERACGSCHRLMTFDFKAVVFKLRNPQGTACTAKGAGPQTRGNTKAPSKIQDVLQEAADHDHVWATRMVCGFCSFEQSVYSQCRMCGKKLARSASNANGKNTRFWEGGEGCRDTRLMNKNDPHRYRGKNKTKSAKHTRVGPKPWSKGVNKVNSEG
eukprot:gene31137-6276_t